MARRRPKRDPKKLTIDVIEARAIVLVDEYGNERATVSDTPKHPFARTGRTVLNQLGSPGNNCSILCPLTLPAPALGTWATEAIS
jgi:hypothetical protein